MNSSVLAHGKDRWQRTGKPFLPPWIANLLDLVGLSLFFLLCCRFLLAQALTTNRVQVALLTVPVALCTGFSPSAALLVLGALLPLLNGLAVAGCLGVQYPPLVCFAALFVVWFPLHARKLWRGKGGDPVVSALIVWIGLGIVYKLSLAPAANLPGTLLFEAVQNINLEYYCLTGGFILLSGLCLLQLCRLTLDQDTFSRGLQRCLPFQALTLVFFALAQIASGTSLPIFWPFDDIHSYASYAVMLFWTLVLTIGSLKKSTYKYIYLFFSISIFILIGVAFSRSAWLSLLLVTFGLIVFKYKCRRLLYYAGFLVLLIAVAMAFMDSIKPVVLQYVAMTGNHTLVGQANQYLDRFYSLFNVVGWRNDPSIMQRLSYYRKALAVVHDYPFTGGGPGSFLYLSRFYVLPLGAYGFRPENVHNYFLQLAAEIGLPGLLAMGTVLAGLLVHRMGGGDRIKLPGILGAAKVGVIAYLLTCLSGHPLLLPGQQLLFWFTLAVVYAGSGYAPSCPSTPGTALAAGGLAVGLFLLGVWCNATNVLGPPIRDYGLLTPERWGEVPVQWTLKRARVGVYPAGQAVSLPVSALVPERLKDRGLRVKFLVGENVLDEVTFWETGTKHLRYLLPDAGDKDVSVEIAPEAFFFHGGARVGSRPQGAGGGPGESGHGAGLLPGVLRQGNVAGGNSGLAPGQRAPGLALGRRTGLLPLFPCSGPGRPRIASARFPSRPGRAARGRQHSWEKRRAVEAHHLRTRVDRGRCAREGPCRHNGPDHPDESDVVSATGRRFRGFTGSGRGPGF